SGADPRRTRLCAGSGPLQRDGRAAFGGAAFHVGRRLADPRDHAGGAGRDSRPRPSQGRLMEEPEARGWVERTFDVPRETLARLDAFADLLREENERQNLVSKGSLDHVWRRHIM